MQAVIRVTWISNSAEPSLRHEDYRLHIPGLGEASTSEDLAIELTDEKIRSVRLSPFVQLAKRGGRCKYCNVITGNLWSLQLANAPFPYLPPSIILTHSERTHLIHLLYGQLVSTTSCEHIEYLFESKDKKHSVILQLQWEEPMPSVPCSSADN